MMMSWARAAINLDLYNTGVDADCAGYGHSGAGYPPIELHASTRCDIRSVEKKAKFLADVGFSQIVLANLIYL